MKHNNITSCLDSLYREINLIKPNGSSLCLEGFHPCIVPLLIKNCLSPFVFFFEDGLIDSFSYLFDDYFNSGTAVSLSYINKSDSPAGFRSENSVRNSASLSLIFSNKPLKFILTEKSIENSFFKEPLSPSVPFFIDKNTRRTDLLGWLKKNNYSRVDFVSSGGDYSERGGIIDVFSYSLKFPVRVNFLDGLPLLSLFNIDSQLTFKKIFSYTLNLSVSGKKSISFTDIIKNKYLSVYIEKNIAFFGGHKNNKKFLLPFLYHPIDKFLNRDKIISSVSVCNYLTNFAIFFNNFYLVPKGFSTNKNKYFNDSILSNGNYSVGDFFIHKKFGVGCFVGLKTSKDGLTEQFVLKYKNNEFVNISVENMESLSFFAHKYEPGISLDSLSSRGSWSRRISGVKNEINTIVDSILLSIKERSMAKRAPYCFDKKDLDFFISKFIYNDTHDQSACWNQILKNLSSEAPMNRLLCGDVGFGKTEIAMRASLIVSYSKQVAIMAPTTILSLQLYNSFIKRFKGFPQKIVLLNRLNTIKEKRKLYKAISLGHVDIIIGTHSLLSNKVVFKRLGLVVIDEEHRFGVKQKEKINNLSPNLDLLSLSATPIPRTLQLSFSGFKSLSLMRSAPLMRKPIITKVLFSSNSVIYKHVVFEVSRGGQVYIVYNSVDNIENYSLKIQRLLPFLRVSYIHGKIPPLKIEKTLFSFINKQLDVLICSSIIEAGIDVPNTNTIIIENSNSFGLAQLYQLRGRVGRSSQQAFALLLVPKNSSLSDLSKRRLKTIEKNNRLGSGYEISKKDLSFRGAGSLFGYSQSGNYSYIGKELYSQLLKERVDRVLPGQKKHLIPLSNIVVNIYDNLNIEESFISNQYLRFEIYKNIFSSLDLETLSKIEAELLDRFGLISDGLFCLFNTQKIRILCSLIGINNIILNSNSLLNIVFSSKIENISPLLSLSNVFLRTADLKFNFVNSPSGSFFLKIELYRNFDVFSFLVKYLNALLNKQ